MPCHGPHLAAWARVRPRARSCSHDRTAQPQRREQLRYENRHADAWTARYSSLSSLRGTVLYLSDSCQICKIHQPRTSTATQTHLGDRLHRAARTRPCTRAPVPVPPGPGLIHKAGYRIVQLCTAVPWYATKLEGRLATAFCAASHCLLCMLRTHHEPSIVPNVHLNAQGSSPPSAMHRPQGCVWAFAPLARPAQSHYTRTRPTVYKRHACPTVRAIHPVR